MINPGNSDKWEIIKGNAKGNTGKLFVTLPKGAEWDMTIYAAGTTKVLSNTSLKTSFALQPGTYDLEINHIWVRGVPVEKGNETRLKAGVLHMTTPDSWTLYDEPKKMVLINSLSPQERGLPIGKYKLSIFGQVQEIEIIDGEGVEDSNLVERNEIAASIKESPIKWDITPVTDPVKDRGFLKFTIPSGVYFSRVIYNSSGAYVNPGTNLAPQSIYNQDVKNMLLPGKYNINILDAIVSEVPIQSGFQTTLKIGYLKLTSPNNLPWYLFDGTVSPNILILSKDHNPFPDLSKPFGLPVGRYKMYFKDAYWPIVITDGKTINFAWPQ